MRLNEMMTIINTLPDEPEIAKINELIIELCPSVELSPEYRMWRKQVIKQEMYQDALISKLEDVVDGYTEDTSVRRDAV